MALPDPRSLPWCIYVRRSSKDADDADLSDAQQEQAARRRVPPGVPVVVIADSGGKNSGGTVLRPGYQRLLAMIREGQIGGVAAYDRSRLNRDTGASAALRDLCMEHGVAIAVDDSPPEHIATAEGGLIWDTSSAADAYLRRKQAEKMRLQGQTAFESGRPRGADPYGYATERNALGGVAQPRRLLVVEDEAAVVRRVFDLLTRHPFAEVAQRLNAEGVLRRDRLWSKESVKDLYRRRRVYCGFVTRRAGRRKYGDGLVLHVVADERPGTHEAILTDEEYSATVAAVSARRCARSAPRRVHRTYLLRGVAYCGSCGSKMRGDARVSRGKAWRYYTCPVSDGKSAIRDDEGNLTPCGARRVPADEAEQSVVSAIEAMRLPEGTIEEQRAELARVLEHEKDGDVGQQRKRLEGVLDALRKQHQWGDLSDDQYRHERSEIEVALAALPGDDSRLERFDQTATLIRSVPQFIVSASPAALQELVAMVVAQVTTADRKVVLPPQWTERARPFFEQPDASCERPRRALGARYRRDDALDWYVA